MILGQEQSHGFPVVSQEYTIVTGNNCIERMLRKKRTERITKMIEKKVEEESEVIPTEKKSRYL